MVSNRLLVIDDEPDVCDFVKEVAEEQGFDVATAEHGRGRRSRPAAVCNRDHRPPPHALLICRCTRFGLPVFPAYGAYVERDNVSKGCFCVRGTYIFCVRGTYIGTYMRHDCAPRRPKQG